MSVTTASVRVDW